MNESNPPYGNTVKIYAFYKSLEQLTSRVGEYTRDEKHRVYRHKYNGDSHIFWILDIPCPEINYGLSLSDPSYKMFI